MPLQIPRKGREPQPTNPEGDSSSQRKPEIWLVLELPPSTNALYRTVRGGGKALSDKAKDFRERVKRTIVDNLARVSAFPTGDLELVYVMDIFMFFDKLENPGWFETWEKDTFVTRGKHKGDLKGKAGERKAKTRYKEIDYDNRIKFLQDCVVKGLGIPSDSQVFGGWQEKHEDPDNPRTEVRVRLSNRDQFFHKKEDAWQR